MPAVCGAAALADEWRFALGRERVDLRRSALLARRGKISKGIAYPHRRHFEMAFGEIGTSLAALLRGHQIAPVDRRRRRLAGVPDIVGAPRLGNEGGGLALVRPVG